MKLAEGLLLRKELQEKVDRAKEIKGSDLFETKVKRISVSDSIDEVTAHVPKLKFSEVTREYDFYARRLRLVDAAIQQANWTTELDVDQTVADNYKEEDQDK